MPRGNPKNGMVDLKSPEGTVSGYVAIPGKGSGPGVLVLHAWWGLNDFFKGVCDQLATAGFIAFAPDLYHGAIPASTIDQAKKLMSTLKTETVREDVVKTMRGLQVHPKVRGKGIGTIGFSMGAFWAVWLAERFPADVSASVVFYGVGEGNFTDSKAAFLGHFAEKDDYEDRASVREFEKLVRAAGKEVAIHRYPGTTHWFFEKDRPDAYDAKAAEIAWQRTLDFLTTRVGGKKS